MADEFIHREISTGDFFLKEEIHEAVRRFWQTKTEQSSASVDTSRRGAVLGGKQLDGFLQLLVNACVTVGLPRECIFLNSNNIPGFFRSSKDWDILIISPNNKLLAVIELKSQVGSYGNNFNNRAEEAIGSATDLWTAFREGEFETCGQPWAGYMMVIGDDDKSNCPVKNHSNHYPVLPEFENASYMDRYAILCRKLISERLYNGCALLATKDENHFRDIDHTISIRQFIASLQGYLTGCRDEFNR